jgi:hypothetical protein
VQLTVPAVPSCIVIIYHSSILLVIATCAGPLTGDRTDEVVALRGLGRAMFPSPPRSRCWRVSVCTRCTVCTIPVASCSVLGIRRLGRAFLHPLEPNVPIPVPVPVPHPCAGVHGWHVANVVSVSVHMHAARYMVGMHPPCTWRGPGRAMFPSPPQHGRRWLGAGPIGSPPHSLVRARHWSLGWLWH